MSLKICITMLLGLTKFNQTIHVFKDNVLEIPIYLAQKIHIIIWYGGGVV